MSSETLSLANGMPLFVWRRLNFCLAWRYQTVRAQDRSLSWFVHLAVDISVRVLRAQDTTNADVRSLHDLRGITIPVFDREKTRASDCTAIVIGFVILWPQYLIYWALSLKCEKWPLASSCLTVRLSSWNNSDPTGRIFMKFYVWVFFENLLINIISLSADKTNGCFMWRPIYVYGSILLHSSTNKKYFTQKLWRKSEHTFYVQ